MPDIRGSQYWPAVKGESAFDMAVREAAEIDRKKQLDAYGLALMMIREGAENPVQIARDAIARFEWPGRPAVRNTETMRWISRKWCEWSHVHSWDSFRWQDEIRMICKRCGRIWPPGHQ